MLTINEILYSPLNTPMPFAKVFLVTEGLEGTPLPFGEAEAASDKDGLIAFNIAKGTYRVFFQQENTSIKYPVGYILEDVFDNPPVPLTLGSILTEELPIVEE
ncbi:hypothetical protein NVP1188A_44 [Vibrio phage 1.188.A._10N.286.51.A6]|uniref:Uncharacterized protein n=4 Tax=Mukerjeevirus TaxID=2733146 RepID=A0A2I7REP1_9CAUD|nr:hypothetical protein HOU76_gp24 [Vibrio phage 1.169.O._10N.261.52.B1]YP_009817503.1 hypothetical protein HOU77_gp62 [Vibrio phage 1.188.A._10N.286.51.A6]AUR93698.1 hypothetical protein NVP1188B_44 [Vibrio phage 1.188.B._10N.286.51.A6]AUR93784.1 hypothetical protein NVP1188C_44 [Vibrio phage 1.188.C._10N.286.51.A6]AUR92103.1 hypothetical protein NVP1169O_75 [Vibrio phage 1.169.O._10N.261.52.B1]AUR93612.1 hypothetical protein NVP1188A_44 [Vibrio phage 1.188.A._10N.286.51.A6]